MSTLDAPESQPPRRGLRRALVVLAVAAAALVLVWGVAERRPRRAPPFVVEKWISTPPETSGKLVMLEFWGTWCGPCVAAIPELNRLQQRFRDDLVIVGISDETEEAVRAQVEPALHYASAIDPRARMARALGVREIPATFLVDADGIVRWQGDPFLDSNVERNRRQWDALMTELIARYGKGRPR